MSMISDSVLERYCTPRAGSREFFGLTHDCGWVATRNGVNDRCALRDAEDKAELRARPLEWNGDFGRLKTRNRKQPRTGSTDLAQVSRGS